MAPGVPQNSLTTNDFTSKLYTAEGGMHLANVPSADENLAFRNFPGLNNMSLGVKKSAEVIGVILADDRAVGKNINTSNDGAIVLGTVCIENLRISLDELRRFMCAELPYLPATFNFLTKDGWPVLKAQEHKINTSHVIRESNCICIKKEYEKPRVGIVTSGGDAVGFVFTDLNINIKQLRETMEQQLKISQQMRLEYRFIEKNGWPVMASQESILSLLDIMLGQIVRIQNSERHFTAVDNVRPNFLMLTNGTSASENQLPSPSQENAEHEPVKRKKSLKFSRDTQSSMKVRKESEKRPRLGKDNYIKPILISYVRAEAAQYALDLKQELVTMGFSVYLDVHEIKTGSDWQDALNFAVTHCFLFVPLITPMYGKTQWTNREIKLADVLGKRIIPVNFMEHWPPACLAIQFASTQYIPWKLQESDHVKEPEKPSDSKHWDPTCIKRVSKQIAECYKDYYFRLPKRSLSNKEIVPFTAVPRSKEEFYTPVKDEYIEDKQSIVISTHPRQRYLAEDLKILFEKNGYEVWCSVDLLDSQINLGSEDITSTDPNTPRNLPTIQEGDVFFNPNDVEMYSSIGEKKTLSMLYKEQEVAYGRRPLSRLMSQLSDISQPSTLSREKLDHLHTFQKKVDQAAVVIVLVSESYTKSTFSHQQVFYCEHRKRVVLVRCDVAPIPKWFRLLMGNDMIMKVNNPQFECVLKARVKRAINPSSSETPKDATAEAKMNCLVNFLKRNLPLQDMCVYVIGSSKLQSQRAEEICKAIGAELAKVERGPGVVHEMEEFIWNDHFLIPIMSTGGAAGGHFGVPVKIFEVPPGVDDADWSVLSDPEATPETVAKAVVNIMLKPKSKSQEEEIEILPPKAKVSLSTMRSDLDIRETSEVSQSSGDEPSSIVKVRRSWWQRFLNALKHKK
ncbi:TIR domain-containing protein [Trichonephila inaurata madagascariensis]|uniref:TIR domain-containing protein n=1 Tax=Trichonephila inaurata madagascariensis TaxID=2747483 RepID=A0A8X7CK26_9ARAC|nr:TIR domain-containing protein [Trichonephila inaurata madagascariensis]